MKIIVLSGKARSGKTTIADHLINNHGYLRASFAAELKRDILDMGFSKEDILCKPAWMRELMIAYGRARRAENPDCWIERLDSWMQFHEREAASLDNLKFVCDDCRFPNELAYFNGLSERGYVVTLIRVERVFNNQYDFDLLNSIYQLDVSETALDQYTDWDYVIQAKSGEIDYLKESIEKILEESPAGTEGPSPQTPESGQGG